MPIMFNALLREAGFPLCDVRLVRHKDKRPGNDVYDWWLNDPKQFESYQSGQSIENRKKFSAPYWAVFIGTPDGRTLFSGIYSVQYMGESNGDDNYDLTLRTEPSALGDLIGRLYIDWGEGRGKGRGGEEAWVQYSDRHDKPITELSAEPIARPGLRLSRRTRVSIANRSVIRSR